MQAGAPIVPLYHLGQSQIISFWDPAYIMGKLRMPLGCMWGRWCLPLPRQHYIITVCSHPIAGEALCAGAGVCQRQCAGELLCAPTVLSHTSKLIALNNFCEEQATPCRHTLRLWPHATL